MEEEGRPERGRGRKRRGKGRGRREGKAPGQQPQLSLQLPATVSKTSADVTHGTEELSPQALLKL